MSATTKTEVRPRQGLDGPAVQAKTVKPRPDLNGRLVQVPGAPQIYLVINGYRRWIPNYETFMNLFPGNANIDSDNGVSLISEGPALSNGAVLAKSTIDVRVYLVSNGIKLWIPTPAIFQSNQFNGNKIIAVAPVIMDALPAGPEIEPAHQA